MAVRTPAPAQAVAASSDSWTLGPEPDADARTAEGRAERWATWVLVYLAVLTTCLALGASVWALGLIR